jgi:hypothetical protein
VSATSREFRSILYVFTQMGRNNNESYKFGYILTQAIVAKVGSQSDLCPQWDRVLTCHKVRSFRGNQHMVFQERCQARVGIRTPAPGACDLRGFASKTRQ